MKTCSRCGMQHEGERIPASLKDRTTICYKCYRETKNSVARKWRAEPENKFKAMKKRQVDRKANPAKTAEEWRDRTRRWKANKKKRKLMVN